jgi:hypothetical protein
MRPKSSAIHVFKAIDFCWLLLQRPIQGNILPGFSFNDSTGIPGLNPDPELFWPAVEFPVRR